MTKEPRTLKIRTKKGKILTIKVSYQDEIFISGYDKFGLFVKIPISEIDESIPITKEEVSE